MVDGARGVLNALLADVYIFTDAVSGQQSGNSPGYGLTLVAETTSGCLISAECCSTQGVELPDDEVRGAAPAAPGVPAEREPLASGPAAGGRCARGAGGQLRALLQRTPPAPPSSPPHRLTTTSRAQEALVVPEDVGQVGARLLLEEVRRGGVVDGSHQSLALTLAALGPDEISQLRLGPLTPAAVRTLRHLRDFLGVTFNIRAERDSQTIFLSCIGANIQNINRKVT